MTLELVTAVELPEPTRFPRLTSRQVLDAIRTRHPAASWIYLEEVRASTGWSSYENHADFGLRRMGRGTKAVEQRIDAWALQMWNPGAILAYEVKISRADFLREIKDPDKRAFALLVSSEFYFATPVRMVRPEEVPTDCGLIEVYEDGRIRTRIKAPSRSVVAPPHWGFVGSLLRRQRREMYATGPGHRGQCPGYGYYEATADEWGRDRRWVRFAATSDEWCGLEAGHPASCRRTRAA